MPNKHNDARRHHIPKMTFKVTNRSVHETGPRRRGSLTLWVSDEAIAAWRAAPRKTPGGQARYSETAIETALMVRLVFHQPPRQTEGLLGSLLELMGIDLPVLDRTTVSRRAAADLAQAASGCRRGDQHHRRRRHPDDQRRGRCRPGRPAAGPDHGTNLHRRGGRRL